MYQLTLTTDERAALEWIGGRYDHGQPLIDILLSTKYKGWWWGMETIEFNIPEHKAWEIKQLIGDKFILDCLSEDLNHKIMKFIENII